MIGREGIGRDREGKGKKVQGKELREYKGVARRSQLVGDSH